LEDTIIISKHLNMERLSRSRPDVCPYTNTRVNRCRTWHFLHMHGSFADTIIGRFKLK